MFYLLCIILGSIPSTSESNTDTVYKTVYKSKRVGINEDLKSDIVLPFKKRKFKEFRKDINKPTLSSLICYHKHVLCSKQIRNLILRKTHRFIKILNLIKPELSYFNINGKKQKVPRQITLFHTMTKKYIKYKLSWYLETRCLSRKKLYEEYLVPKIENFVNSLLKYEDDGKEYEKDTFISFIKESKDIRSHSYKSKICFSHFRFQELFNNVFLNVSYFILRNFVNIELRNFRYYNLFPELVNIDMYNNLKKIAKNKILKIYIWMLIVNRMSDEFSDKIKEISTNEINVIDFEYDEVFSNLYICYVHMIYILVKPTKNTEIFNTRRSVGDIITNLCVALVDYPNKVGHTSLFMIINRFKSNVSNFKSLSFRLFITFNILLLNNFLSEIPRGNNFKNLDNALLVFNKRIDYYFDNYNNLNRMSMLKSYYKIQDLRELF